MEQLRARWYCTLHKQLIYQRRNNLTLEGTLALISQKLNFKNGYEIRKEIE